MSNDELYKVATPDAQYYFRPNLFLWPNLTLFIGPLHQLELHSMGSVAINVGLYDPFLMKMMNGKHMPYRCAVIPAGCKHEINAYGSIVASLVFEINSAEFISFRKHFPFQATTITEIFNTEWIGLFQKVYEEKPSKKVVKQLLDRLLNIENKPEKKIDSRIDTAMQMIKHDPGNDFSQEYLASSVGLSASRFRHLFSEHSDIPFRRYRMWQRVILAMKTLHKVDNLTHAAMEAGFTDSAHFTRCFKDTFGVNPSLVFRNLDRFEI